MPNRIQLSRRRGFRLPDGAVSVARPHRWGNPHRVGEADTPTNETAVEAFRRDLVAGRLRITVEQVRSELRGKHLACWCRLDQACHADVLLSVANEADQEGAK